MTMPKTPEWITGRLKDAARLWLFLDYDGTLAEFAPTPDDVLPDQELIELVVQLVLDSRIRVSVISGRRLAHVKRLVPVAGVDLAGTYGVELLMGDGNQIERVPYESVRPTLEEIKPQWESIIKGLNGFYLEDKGWSLALHARFAESHLAEDVLSAAHSVGSEFLQIADLQMLGGHKFLEVSPAIADKGRAVEHLLDYYPDRDAILLYLGDDDKDERAFKVINEYSGISILVSGAERKTCADMRLDSPASARRWLRALISLK
jgi:trehalose 6-phosphate phosphatase